MTRDKHEIRRVGLAQVLGDTILAGSGAGRLALAAILSAAGEEPASPTPLLVDFQNVEIATASFLRECLLGVRELLRNRRSNLYPVAANLPQVVLDELTILLHLRNDALLTCRTDESGNVAEPRIVGILEAKQLLTLDLVRARGETDAGELLAANPEAESVGHTAWNNRLASLASLGLVVEKPQGRTKRYSVLLG
jgi:hypothetical protein